MTPIHTFDDTVDWSKLQLPGVVLQGMELQAVPAELDYLAYCDGACSGNPGPGGWGMAIAKKNVRGATFAYGSSKQTTNNKMELAAAIETLKQVERGARILLHTDSQYVIKGSTEWRKGWERNGMRNSKKEPVANPDQWLELWALIDARRVFFKWVKGHSGEVGNELVDKLAQRGSREAA